MKFILMLAALALTILFPAQALIVIGALITLFILYIVAKFLINFTIHNFDEFKFNTVKAITLIIAVIWLPFALTVRLFEPVFKKLDKVADLAKSPFIWIIGDIKVSTTAKVIAIIFATLIINGILIKIIREFFPLL